MASCLVVQASTNLALFLGIFVVFEWSGHGSKTSERSENSVFLKVNKSAIFTNFSKHDLYLVKELKFRADFN